MTMAAAGASCKTMADAARCRYGMTAVAARCKFDTVNAACKAMVAAARCKFDTITVAAARCKHTYNDA